jgi:hypothetical protein
MKYLVEAKVCIYFFYHRDTLLNLKKYHAIGVYNIYNLSWVTGSR